MTTQREKRQWECESLSHQGASHQGGGLALAGSRETPSDESGVYR